MMITVVILVVDKDVDLHYMKYTPGWPVFLVDTLWPEPD